MSIFLNQIKSIRLSFKNLVKTSKTFSVIKCLCSTKNRYVEKKLFDTKIKVNRYRKLNWIVSLRLKSATTINTQQYRKVTWNWKFSIRRSQAKKETPTLWCYSTNMWAIYFTLFRSYKTRAYLFLKWNQFPIKKVGKNLTKAIV